MADARDLFFAFGLGLDHGDGGFNPAPPPPPPPPLPPPLPPPPPPRPPRPPPPLEGTKAAAEDMAAVAALARFAITLEDPWKYLAAAAGVLAAITVAGRDKRRMVGDGDGLGLSDGGIINSQFYNCTRIMLSRRVC